MRCIRHKASHYLKTKQTPPPKPNPKNKIDNNSIQSWSIDLKHMCRNRRTVLLPKAMAVLWTGSYTHFAYLTPITLLSLCIIEFFLSGENATLKKIRPALPFQLLTHFSVIFL